MPKRQLSVLAGEEALARRIAYERGARGWSTNKLARLVTEAGCSINQSGVWKIENGVPRRKITVGEAIAFAKVFKIPLAELLEPPEESVTREAAELANKIADLAQEVFERYVELGKSFGRLAELGAAYQGAIASGEVAVELDAPTGEDASLALWATHVDTLLASCAAMASASAPEPGLRALLSPNDEPEQRTPTTTREKGA